MSDEKDGPLIAYLRSIDLTEYLGKGREVSYTVLINDPDTGKQSDEIVHEVHLPLLSQFVLFLVFSLAFWAIMVGGYQIIKRRYTHLTLLE